MKNVLKSPKPIFLGGVCFQISIPKFNKLPTETNESYVGSPSVQLQFSDSCTALQLQIFRLQLLHPDTCTPTLQTQALQC